MAISRARVEGPVHEELERAHRQQPVRIREDVTRAVTAFDRLVQQVPRDHARDPGRRGAAARPVRDRVRVLVVDDLRHPARGRRGHRFGHPLVLDVDRGRRELGRRAHAVVLQQHTRRVVAADQLQRRRAQPQRVQVRAEQRHRPAGQRPLEQVLVRPVRPERVAEPGAHDQFRLPRRRRQQVRQQQLDRLTRRPRRFERDPAAEGRPLHQVDVRVDETGQQRAPVPVDDPRGEPGRSRLGDRRDAAVVHPDVRELPAESRPHPAQQ